MVQLNQLQLMIPPLMIGAGAKMGYEPADEKYREEGFNPLQLLGAVLMMLLLSLVLLEQVVKLLQCTNN